MVVPLVRVLVVRVLVVIVFVVRHGDLRFIQVPCGRSWAITLIRAVPVGRLASVTS
jgi:hypothetical protein